MKVYELMNLLSELPSGSDVKVSICMTTEELKGGDEIESGLYCKSLKIVDVDENGNIGTEV